MGVTMKLSPAQQRAIKQIKETNSIKGIRRNTLRALDTREMLQYADDGTVSVKEMLAPDTTVTYRTYTRRYSTRPTYDINLTDAAFWDKARNGKAKGLMLAGALLKPIASKIAAWAFGIVPKFTFDDDYTGGEFTKWFTANHPELLRGYEDSIALGNVWTVVNADLSVTPVPPDVVTEMVDENDYSKVTGWQVKEIYPHPERPADTMTIVDRYTPDGRTRIIERNGLATLSTTYRNLIGMLPIVHVKNNAGINERFGKPDAHALLPVLSEYDDVLYAAITGNKRMGRPTPVFEKMGSQKQVEAFHQQFGKRVEYLDENGEKKYRYEYTFDADDTQVIGGDGTFNYKQPGSFMGDVEKLITVLYYLIIEHLELPEWLMGTALTSSKASAETQVEPFVKFIEKKQGLMRYWLQEIVSIVLSYMSLYDSQIKVEIPVIQFAPLVTTDGKLTLDAISLGLKEGLLDRETALRLMPLDIDDPRAVLDAVDAEAAAAADAFERSVDAKLKQAEDRLDDEENTDDAGSQTDDADMQALERLGA